MTYPQVNPLHLFAEPSSSSRIWISRFGIELSLEHTFTVSIRRYLGLQHVQDWDMDILVLFGSCFIFLLCTAVVLDWKLCLRFEISSIDSFDAIRVNNIFETHLPVCWTRICHVELRLPYLMHVQQVCGFGLHITISQHEFQVILIRSSLYILAHRPVAHVGILKPIPGTRTVCTRFSEPCTQLPHLPLPTLCQVKL